LIENPKEKVLEIKVNLQNPSSEILRENATEDSDYIAEKFEGFVINPLINNIRTKNKSLAFPLQLNCENSLVTPKKKDEIKRTLLKDPLTFPEKKKIVHHNFKSQNAILPFLRNSSETNKVKNHNFTYFIESEHQPPKTHKKNCVLPKKSISLQAEKTRNPLKLLEKSLSTFNPNNKNFLSHKNYSFESPDIKEFYKDIQFPEEGKKTQKSANYSFNNPTGKANLVYYLQAKINIHSKAKLDKKFATGTINKIEENFESEDLSEGISEEMTGEKMDFF